MLKKIQNDKAESRYWETLEHYRRAMEQNPALTLKAYSDSFIRKIQHKINRRPRKKLNFQFPMKVFFQIIANFALAS